MASNGFEINNMQILMVAIIVVTAIAINEAGSYQILTTNNNQQVVLCVKAIVQRHFSSRNSIIVSVTNTGLDDTENSGSVSPYWEQAMTTDALLDSIHGESRWALHISRPTSNLQAFRPQGHKWNYIIMIWESQGNRTATEITTSQLQALQDAGLLSSKSLFLIVICSRVSHQPRDFALRIFEDLWHRFKIIDVTIVIPYFNTPNSFTSALHGVQNSSIESFDLYTWYPFLSSGTCGNVSRVDVIDKWLVGNSKGFLRNNNLFPNKISGNLMGCTVRVATRVLPPIIVELVQGSKKEYSGPELNILRCILEKLNLSIEYKVLVSTNKSQFEMEAHLTDETMSGDTDISVGGLTVSDRFISRADSTLPYLEYAVQWYVPCAKCANPWTALLRVYTLDSWICVLCTPIPMIICMHQLAIRVNKYQLRESQCYMTLQSCFSIFYSIALGVSVTELPRTPILRTFVFFLICFSLFMSTTFQNYYTTFLLNPGFEKQISNVRDILQSGIQFGYSSGTEGSLKYIANEYEYSVMQDRRIVCENHCQCLELMLKDVNFACVSNTYCAELVMQSRVSSYARRNLCVLPNVIYRIRSTMYLKKGHPLLNHFNKIIRRMTEAGLISKWKKDFMSKQKSISVLSSLSYGKDNFGIKNIVADNIYEAGYFALSLSHLTVAFHILFFGCSLSLTVLIAELVYRRILGYTKKTDL